MSATDNEFVHSRIVSLTTYLAIGVTIIDQLSKRWALSILSDPETYIPLTGFLNAQLSINHRLNFDIGGTDFSWLVSVAFIIIGLAVFFVLNGWRMQMTSALCGTGAGLAMGGIIGNLIDRLRFGGVTDFLVFHIGRVHTPIVNVADCAMMLGLFLLLMGIFSKEP